MISDEDNECRRLLSLFVDEEEEFVVLLEEEEEDAAASSSSSTGKGGIPGAPERRQTSLSTSSGRGRATTALKPDGGEWGRASREDWGGS